MHSVRGARRLGSRRRMQPHTVTPMEHSLHASAQSLRNPIRGLAFRMANALHALACPFYAFGSWCSSRDISERKRAEAAANRRLAAIVECSDDAIIGKTLDGIITSWNPAAERLYGYEAREVIGRPIALLVPPDRSDELLTILRSLRSGERVEHLETVRVRKDGRAVAVALSISPVQESGGRIVGAATIARDITERLRVEQRQRLLVDATRAFGEVVTDLGALLERVARLLAEATGAACSVRLLAGDGAFSTAAYHPDPHRRAAAQAMLDLTHASDEELGIRDVPLVARGRLIGSLLLVSYAEGVPFDPAAEALVADLAGRAALAIDSAQLYEAEQAARAAAEAAVQLRDEFLSVAAHELKTPITALRLQAQLTLRRLESLASFDAGHIRRSLQQIDSQSQKLARLGDQLLDLTSLDAGQLHLELKTLDVCQIVANAVASARSTLAPARLVVHLPTGPVPISADASRLERVLTNLLDNAVKFTPDGGQIAVEISEARDGFVRVAVRDHGVSVPPEKRGQIFERFYEAHRTEHRSGLGLGLYLSQQIVQLHGGRMGVEFPADGGTRFVVQLPVETRLLAPAEIGARPCLRSEWPG